MNLPKDSTHKMQLSEPKKQRWVAVLSIIAIVVSLASAGFSALIYFNTPLQIHNYVQAHKNELKGRDGRDGLNGRNGSNSYSPTYCSTYDYSFGSSTSCY